MPNFERFNAIGVNVQASQVTHVKEVGGFRTETKFGLYTCVLPAAPKVQASFSAEGLGKQVIKLFKKEIQVGDKVFDDAVYISTDTPVETAALLTSEKIQNTILMCVTSGGHVEIAGNRVVAQIPAEHLEDDRSLYELVRALMGI